MARYTVTNDPMGQRGPILPASTPLYPIELRDKARRRNVLAVVAIVAGFAIAAAMVGVG